MASGDTKTEAMLNVLGNGGSGDEFRGCCNTKTQAYILDAIDRINNLDPGGGGGGDFNILTEDDLNWQDQQTGDEYVALWLLPTGHYTTDENSPNVAVYSYEQDGDFVPGDTVSVEMSPLIIINNYDPGNTYPDIMIIYPDDIAHYIIDGSTGLVDSFQNYGLTFSGTDGISDGTPGLVPAPSTADVDKFLKSDGTWDTAGGAGPTVVQTTGTSQTDVMSQNAVTSMVYHNPSTLATVKIGYSTTAYGSGSDGVIIGTRAEARGYGVALGRTAAATNGYEGVAIGDAANANANYSVAIGAASTTTRAGEVNIGSGSQSWGYNNTVYRILGGVHDGVDAHDAATVAQGNTLSTSAPDTSTVGVLGQLWTDTTNMHTYQCTAISGNTYTWTQRW